MEKEFIPYELALKLKEIGFDKACLAFSYIISEYGYKEHELYLVDSFDELIKNTEHTYYYARPTYEQAFDWFRNKGYDSAVIEKQKDKGKFYGGYIQNGEDFWGKSIGSNHKTYEEARLACLEKLIELCKKN